MRSHSPIRGSSGRARRLTFAGIVAAVVAQVAGCVTDPNPAALPGASNASSPDGSGPDAYATDADRPDRRDGSAPDGDDGDAPDGAASDGGASTPESGPSPTPLPTRVACSFKVTTPTVNNLPPPNSVTNAALDAAGRIAIAGLLELPFDLGGGHVLVPPSVPPGVPSNSNFVAVFDSDCHLVWAKAVAYVADLAFDSGGNLWVLDALPGAALTKYDPAGNVLFQTDGTDVRMTGIAVDGHDSVYVTGQHQPTAEYAGATLPTTTAPEGFVMKLTPAGVSVWVRDYASAADGCLSWVGPVVVTPSGDLAILGYAAETSTGAGCHFTLESPPAKTSTLEFVARLSASDGAPLWVRAWADGSFATLGQVCATASSDVLITGSAGYVDLGSGPLPVSGSDFIARIAPSGALRGGERLPPPAVNTTKGTRLQCGAGAGERAILAGFPGASSGYVQILEADGSGAWTYPSEPATVDPPGVALGPHGDVAIAGSEFELPTNPHDLPTPVLVVTRYTQ